MNDCFGEVKGKICRNDYKSGIHIIDTNQKQKISIKPGPGKFTEALFVDSQGIIWSGDINNSRENIGLNRYIKTPSYFKHYLTNNNETVIVSKHFGFSIIWK